MNTKRLTKAERLREIKGFVNLCFGMLEDLSYAQVALKSGLCEGTVRRLASNDFTLRVTVGSIQALGYAAGLRLELTKYKSRVRLAA
jgi:hypothetical protein